MHQPLEKGGLYLARRRVTSAAQDHQTRCHPGPANPESDNQYRRRLWDHFASQWGPRHRRAAASARTLRPLAAHLGQHSIVELERHLTLFAATDGPPVSAGRRPRAAPWERRRAAPRRRARSVRARPCRDPGRGPGGSPQPRAPPALWRLTPGGEHRSQRGRRQDACSESSRRSLREGPRGGAALRLHPADGSWMPRTPPALRRGTRRSETPGCSPRERPCSSPLCRSCRPSRSSSRRSRAPR